MQNTAKNLSHPCGCLFFNLLPTVDTLRNLPLAPTKKMLSFFQHLRGAFQAEGDSGLAIVRGRAIWTPTPWQE